MIQRVHVASRQRYGSLGVHAELQAQEIRCDRRGVAQLGRQAALQGKYKGRQRLCTTDSKHKLPGVENVLQWDFRAARPNAKWVADITPTPTDEEWLYLAAVVDIFSRKGVGWATEATLTSERVECTLDAALVTRRPQPGLLHHSDRGSQDAGHDDQACLQAAQVQVSVSCTSNRYDNALEESFWVTLKIELVGEDLYASHGAARHDILLSIEGLYNLQCRHSTLGYLSPTDFEHHHLLTFSLPKATGTYVVLLAFIFLCSKRGNTTKTLPHFCRFVELKKITKLPLLPRPMARSQEVARVAPLSL